MGRGLQKYRSAKRRHLILGRRGERLASIGLREMGMVVLTRNFATDRGELDIVARDGGTLCFVEVKTRRREILGTPADAVGWRKRKCIISAAKAYHRAIGRPPLVIRFDIVEVILDGRKLKAMRHWPDAFVSEDTGFSASSWN